MFIKNEWYSKSDNLLWILKLVGGRLWFQLCRWHSLALKITTKTTLKTMIQISPNILGCKENLTSLHNYAKKITHRKFIPEIWVRPAVCNALWLPLSHNMTNNLRLRSIHNPPTFRILRMSFEAFNAWHHIIKCLCQYDCIHQGTTLILDQV